MLYNATDPADVSKTHLTRRKADSTIKDDPTTSTESQVAAISAACFTLWGGTLSPKNTTCSAEEHRQHMRDALAGECVEHSGPAIEVPQKTLFP